MSEIDLHIVTNALPMYTWRLCQHNFCDIVWATENKNVKPLPSKANGIIEPSPAVHSNQLNYGLHWFAALHYSATIEKQWCNNKDNII